MAHIKTLQAKHVAEIVLGLYILLYFVLNLLFLTEFPYVHSDESWLSGLTRNMLETGSLGVTETFFDLKPRFPHAIKMIFHLIQMPFILIFGYNIFSVRLLSLLFGCFSLIIFYFFVQSLTKDFSEKLDKISGKSTWFSLFPLLSTVSLSCTTQFIYASHFARQEILLVFCLIASAYGIYKGKFLLSAAITGLSIGLHPNSFILGTMCLLLLIPSMQKKWSSIKEWRPLLGYTSATGFMALIFVGISLYHDRNFFQHYLSYGSSEFDVTAPVTSKLLEFPAFLQKIWLQVSGTYLVPDIRLELVLFALALLAGCFLLWKNRNTRHEFEHWKEISFLLRGIAGIFLGMTLIGRYNQTSIIFFFPLFFALMSIEVICLFRLLPGGKKNGAPLFLALLTIVIGISACLNILPWMQHSYSNYLYEISRAVTPQSKVIGNLNSEFYFENGMLLDYRNLSYLKENGLTIEDYVRKNNIEFIIMSEELDLIYSQRPIWNIIYGNLRYLEELQEFTKASCTLVHRFQDNVYGVRIVEYIDSDRNFTVQIFKVNDLS